MLGEVVLRGCSDAPEAQTESNSTPPECGGRSHAVLTPLDKLHLATHHSALAEKNASCAPPYSRIHNINVHTCILHTKGSMPPKHHDLFTPLPSFVGTSSAQPHAPSAVLFLSNTTIVIGCCIQPSHTSHHTQHSAFSRHTLHTPGDEHFTHPGACRGDDVDHLPCTLVRGSCDGPPRQRHGGTAHAAEASQCAMVRADVQALRNHLFFTFATSHRPEDHYECMDHAWAAGVSPASAQAA